MKKLKSLKKVLLMLIVAAIFCSFATVSKATGDVNDLFDIPKVEEGNNPTPTPIPTSTPTPTPQPTNNNNSLPKTGVNDTIMWVIIGACVVAAIYTYKKINDYNV